MAEIDLYPIGESTWIDSTYPGHADGGVGTADDFTVTFSKTVSTACLTADIFRLLDETGAEIVDPFNSISVSNDYNEITKTITLSLSVALDASSNYTFIIDGLYDPVGDDQDVPHVITFTTSDVQTDIAAVQSDIDVITATDHSLIDDPISVVSTSGAATLVSSLPTNEAYNLDGGYNSGLVTIHMNEDLGTPYILVERKVIAMYESPWATVTPESVGLNATDDSIVEIQLPEVSTGVYISDGYEYKVTLLSTTTLADTTTTIDEDVSIVFTGTMSPMYTSVSNVLMQYPYYSSYETAKMIYLMSAYALTVDDSISATAPSKAATNYVTYAALWTLSTRGGDQKTIELGDLTVTKKTDTEDLSALWRRLADDALGTLGQIGPTTVIKGGAFTSPFATRNWGQ